MILPFLRAHRLSWNRLVRICHTVITPTALYELKVATLTKCNRDSSKRMEYNIVTKLCDLGHTRIESTHDLSERYNHHQEEHIHRRPANDILRQALKYQMRGKSKVGRPCFTWTHSLNRDLTRTDMNDWLATIDDEKLHVKKCVFIYIPN